MAYREAYHRQQQAQQRVLAARLDAEPLLGEVLLVQHDPVITLSAKARRGENLLATPEMLARHGVALEETDRGGDITYHGPGQLVVYPILDLQRLGIRLHAYLRLLEGAVIEAVGRFGVRCERDACATGVWVPHNGEESAKIAAIGVRVSRWITLHGLALNVTTDLDHFKLIVPCGLAGRPVTSMRRELGERCPPMNEVSAALLEALLGAVQAAAGPELRR